ncbi:metalloregulator ArsR/SmtB family transcription factor [Ideonella livida]|uniref:Winged helix-turn-helix transcriptional regulator n=1 Tax=Ideonella livida TaxID=2707176 RepID=A0A7C9PJV1_9BURK|nr:metalloregulator ArsR/SmtB family transcription factor [Ideonella livida]NDY93835.1 winged helix-turn-helix transcriptional regulator [Ideonella livida]
MTDDSSPAADAATLAEAALFKALADPTRRRILALLRERPMTAGEIAERFALANSTLSAHFNVLRESGLVTSSRPGTTYRLEPEAARAAWQTVGRVLGMGAPEDAPGPRA